MEVPLSSLLIALVVLISFSSFFSASETAYSTCNKIRLRQMANRGNTKAAAVLNLCENYDALLSTILVGNNFVNIAASTIATVLFTKMLGAAEGPSVATIVMTIVVLLFGEITPKTLAKEYADEFAMFSYSVFSFIKIILTPFTFLFGLWQKLCSLLFSNKNKQGVTGEELITMIEEVEKEGSIEKDESELIRSAIEFSDVDIEDIYTPRVDVVGVEVDSNLSEIEKEFEENSFSRLPVYKDTIDNIIGFIHQKDFYEMGKKNQTDIHSIMQTPLYLPLTTRISDALKQLQVHKVHLAIVIDEYGGTAGIITLEDIIEELVGEIWDEHDEVMNEIIKLDENKYKFAGTVNIDELFDIFRMYEDDIYTSNTISGWIIEIFERIPEVGEEVDYKNLKIKILDTDDRKINWVEIQKVEANQEDEDDEKTKNRN